MAAPDSKRPTSSWLRSLPRAAGPTWLRSIALLPQDGARPTELAAGGWVSKQAIGQRVRELVELGLVRTDPDPTDRRAVIVRRTPAGDRVADELRRVIADLENTWAEQVGKDQYATFRAVLDELGSHRAPPSPTGA